MLLYLGGQNARQYPLIQVADILVLRKELGKLFLQFLFEVSVGFRALRTKDVSLSLDCDGFILLTVRNINHLQTM